MMIKSSLSATVQAAERLGKGKIEEKIEKNVIFCENTLEMLSNRAIL